MTCAPGVSGVVGVYVKLPSASAETCPTGLPSMMMVTVEPGSAVPVIGDDRPLHS